MAVYGNNMTPNRGFFNSYEDTDTTSAFKHIECGWNRRYVVALVKQKCRLDMSKTKYPVLGTAQGRHVHSNAISL